MIPSFSKETIEMFSAVSCKKHRLNAALSRGFKGGQSRVFEDPTLGALIKTPIRRPASSWKITLGLFRRLRRHPNKYHGHALWREGFRCTWSTSLSGLFVYT